MFFLQLNPACSYCLYLWKRRLTCPTVLGLAVNVMIQIGSFRMDGWDFRFEILVRFQIWEISKRYFRFEISPVSFLERFSEGDKDLTMPILIWDHHRSFLTTPVCQIFMLPARFAHAGQLREGLRWWSLFWTWLSREFSEAPCFTWFISFWATCVMYWLEDQPKPGKCQFLDRFWF